MNSYTAVKHVRAASIFVVVVLILLLATPYAAAQPTPDRREGYSYARVTPSMAIIIVVLIAALFFMGFFSIYIRHCTESGVGSVRPVGGGNPGRSRRGAAARGLDADVIETFPTLVYSEVKGLKIGKGALECAVCLCEFEDDETLRLIPKCDHVFHPECIDVWLASHTTCPVCRANLTPQPCDSDPQPIEESDIEAQNDVVEVEPEVAQQDNRENTDVVPPEPEVISVSKTLNRNRTRGSISGRPRRFPRSHSTGHSLVQPGESMDRFTLRLPVEVRKQVIDRELNRTTSMAVFARERSSRRGYRMGSDGSSKGKHLSFKRLEKWDQKAKSDRWVSSVTQPFFARASSFLMRGSSSFKSPKSPKVVTTDGEGSSTRLVQQGGVEPTRPPV